MEDEASGITKRSVSVSPHFGPKAVASAAPSQPLLAN